MYYSMCKYQQVNIVSNFAKYIRPTNSKKDQLATLKCNSSEESAGTFLFVLGDNTCHY